MIYLDYAATTPMSDKALQTYIEAAKHCFGNEQSLHDVGSAASTLLDACRKELALLINGKEQGIFFTSGGSEANYLALHSLITAHSEKGKHIITTPIEHASIFNYFNELKKQGYTITSIPVDCYGLVDLEVLEAAITPETILASIQHGNSEIGTVQPLAKIGEVLKKHDVLFHTDCVQTFGKVAIDVQSIGIDSLSISAHKIYGPKGVGACYINPEVHWKPLFTGTSHERGFRPGTVNVPGIASFVTAAQSITAHFEEEQERLSKLRQLFIEGLQAINHSISVEGHPSSHLPGIIGVTIEGIEGQYTMLACNQNGIAISTGSACQVGKQEPSRTMIAIGKEVAVAKQYVRFSLGKETTEEDLHKLLYTLDKMILQFF
ncbi:IscS subfamily cysteine desulfurase [Microbacteriaceae bacterium 4G12]